MPSSRVKNLQYDETVYPDRREAARPRNRQPEVSTGARFGGALVSRRDPVAARVIQAWRELTSARTGRRTGKGAPTLVACSGGADSVALVIALHAAGGKGSGGVGGAGPVIVGHVVHNLRRRAEALADRDSVRELAQRLGLKFVELEVKVTNGRNAEGEARRLRYQALGRMAREQGAAFVATGHQGDDQLETMLMALARGTGLKGLGGMRTRRRLDGGTPAVWLVRPMVHESGGVTREEAEALCRRAGVAWQVDATNADTTRLRAAIRQNVVPALRAIRPGVESRACQAAGVVRAAERLVARRGRNLARRAAAASPAGTCEWGRGEIAKVPDPVLGETLRQAYRILIGKRGLDTITHEAVARVMVAIRDGSTDPRRFVLGGMGVLVEAKRVRLSKRARAAR